MQESQVNNLVINKLTKAQYESISSPSSTELYFVTDDLGIEAKDLLGTNAIGSGTQLVHWDGNNLVASTSDVGSNFKSIYLEDGTLKASDHGFAGGYLKNNVDLNTLYDAGFYACSGGNVTNYPAGGDKFGAALVVPYRKPNGNTTPDYTWQMLSCTQTNDRLWYRTSYSTGWRDWRQIVSIATNTAVGGTTQPVYVDANGKVQAITGSIANSTTGNAATATEFSAGTTVALTGDVTGTSSSSKKGWSVATTIGAGKVTNAMLAGSISNDKLTNSKITIAGNEVSLGGSISLDDLGLSHAMHFKGITTTALDDDATTSPITINNASYTQQEGDVVLYSDAEYVWTGSKWERLGRDSSFKTTQSTVDSGAAATNKWVSRIQQDANGVVTTTMGTLDTSGTWFGTANKATAANLTTTQNAIAKYSDTTGTFANSGVIIDNNNNITTTGGFIGNGSNLISLNASNISSGTVTFARLPSMYWANTAIASTASYNTTPEVASIKIGNGTATAAGAKGATLQYDATLETLNFIFA